MKLFMAISLSAMWLSAAEGQSKAPPEKPARVTRPVEIPNGAVEVEPGTFRVTDVKGKTWFYRRTPFGVMRCEERPEDLRVKAADEYLDVKAVEDGESIRFERPTPFGLHQWTTKKSELDEMERTVWNREKTKTAGDKD